jgi:hypothetical protein
MAKKITCYLLGCDKILFLAKPPSPKPEADDRAPKIALAALSAAATARRRTGKM